VETEYGSRTLCSGHRALSAAVFSPFIFPSRSNFPGPQFCLTDLLLRNNPHSTPSFTNRHIVFFYHATNLDRPDMQQRSILPYELYCPMFYGDVVPPQPLIPFFVLAFFRSRLLSKGLRDPFLNLTFRRFSLRVWRSFLEQQNAATQAIFFFLRF